MWEEAVQEGGRNTMLEKFSLTWKIAMCPLWHHRGMHFQNTDGALHFQNMCLSAYQHDESTFLYLVYSHSPLHHRLPHSLSCVKCVRTLKLCASPSYAWREVTAGSAAGQLWQLQRLLMYQHMDSVLMPTEAHNYQHRATAFPFFSVLQTF